MMNRYLSIVILFFFLPWVSKAQLCTGSLGDPILNDHFGNGHVSALPPNMTTYKYVGGCPKKGEYTLSSFLFGCGDRTWVQMVGDHYFPGNQQGNYMLVNAAGTPGTVYVDTIFDLCGNTTYQFAAYVTSVMQDLTCNGNSPKANLTFAVEKTDGTEIASNSTGFIPIEGEKKWIQYGVSFTTTTSLNSVIVRIKTNPNPMDACEWGSSFAIDDVTFNQCGPTVQANIDGSVEDANVCENYSNPFVLNADVAPGYRDPVVQWQQSLDSGFTWEDIPGANSTTYKIPKRSTGTIAYHMIAAERNNINSPHCRTSSNVIFTTVHPSIPHQAPQFIKGCTGTDYYLPAADPSSLSNSWIGPNSYQSTEPKSFVPKLQFSDTGLYTLNQTFYFGCTTIDSFYLSIYPGIVVTADSTHPLCEGQSLQLHVSTNDKGRIKWTPPEGLSNDTIPNPLATPTENTWYKIKATNIYGCEDSATLPILVYKNPVADAGEDKIILTGDTTSLDGKAEGTEINYYWTPSDYLSDPNILQPLTGPPSEKEYTLRVESNVGCGVATDNVLVKVYDDFFIPNAFTPNGDGKNDVFRILKIENYELKMFQIYDRWGKVIFKSDETFRGWDGTLNGIPQQTGIYIYQVLLQGVSGKTISRSGQLLLIR